MQVFHDGELTECDAAQSKNKAYECPSSKSPHPVRKGAIPVCATTTSRSGS